MKSKVHPSRRGSALVAATVGISALAGLSVSLLMVTRSASLEQRTELDNARAMYSAQAAVSTAVMAVREAAENEQTPPGWVWNADVPLTLGSGSSYASIDDLGDGSYTITSYGRAGESARALEVTLAPSGGGAFSRALFAGNRTEDPNYALELGGLANEADVITGDVYSAGDIVVDGDASVSGDVLASGTITGVRGTEGVSLPMPDLSSMDYENNNDFDVADLFSTATWTWDDAGGHAWQMPEESPAHIFRKNPNDRNSTNNATAKDDYYLEDPYEPVRRDVNWDGSDAFPVTLSGQDGNPGVNGTDAVYYIDGNLWIHNIPTYSFKFVGAAGEDVRATFVVKGNITFSDNVFYEDSDTDGLVFIALDDPDVQDSGNIYFGDPVGGTIEYMDAFMYAENNFYDTNLSASGSKKVTVTGTMSAGNHVAIERDHGNSHSRLTVTADLRLEDGDLTMPGVPPSLSGAATYSVRSWREVAYDPVTP